MSFSLNQLTEGIKTRNVGAANRRLLEKWGRTGLLRGLEGTGRENMATLLENQAGQVLREASSLGGDGGGADIKGFTNIAFPIVRRVFGGLIANELVSIQPMSLPSGLLFYLDYTYGSNAGGDIGANDDATYKKGESIYGNPTNPGVNGASQATGGQYDLAGSGFSRAQVESSDAGVADMGNQAAAVKRVMVPGTFTVTGNPAPSLVMATDSHRAAISYDPQVTKLIDDAVGNFTLVLIPWTTGNFSGMDTSLIKEVALWENTEAVGIGPVDAVDDTVQGGTKILNVRRLNKVVKIDLTTASTSETVTDTPEAALGTANTHLLMVVAKEAGNITDLDIASDGGACHLSISGPKGADTSASSDLATVVSPAFEADFGAGTTNDIPEIDIKIESVSVVAQTRKLRARWSPELAQDLNAYHSLDAEVELTQILSEQVALEIDREILGDLLHEAGAANFFWSRSPGNFVNKRSGVPVSRASSLRPGPQFTGTVREWYETLIETVIDVANEIHRKTLRGAANFMVVSPEIATILEASILYKPALSIDGDGQVGNPISLGAEKVGTLSSRFTVYKDPYFPRNKILVGFKGSSYLETGYVYAPYVPLIVTPTIFAPEDFTPRKGVMTRYGKKMVRSDFYGSVTCLDMDII